jgi:hypothetical protein
VILEAAAPPATGDPWLFLSIELLMLLFPVPTEAYPLTTIRCLEFTWSMIMLSLLLKGWTGLCSVCLSDMPRCRELSFRSGVWLLLPELLKGITSMLWSREKAIEEC